jgi:hypothetical protein
MNEKKREKETNAEQEIYPSFPDKTTSFVYDFVEVVRNVFWPT